MSLLLPRTPPPHRSNTYSFLLLLFLRPPYAYKYKSKLYRCCAPNASMCPPCNGSGPIELEKSHHAPPTIAIQTSDDVPDAGLRSLDHCEFSCAATAPHIFFLSITCLKRHLGRFVFAAYPNFGSWMRMIPVLGGPL